MEKGLVEQDGYINLLSQPVFFRRVYFSIMNRTYPWVWEVGKDFPPPRLPFRIVCLQCTIFFKCIYITRISENINISSISFIFCRKHTLLPTAFDFSTERAQTTFRGENWKCNCQCGPRSCIRMSRKSFGKI